MTTCRKKRAGRRAVTSSPAPVVRSAPDLPARKRTGRYADRQRSGFPTKANMGLEADEQETPDGHRRTIACVFSITILIESMAIVNILCYNWVEVIEMEQKMIREVLETPVKGEYDVLVVGGGPAGCAAAIGAARAGASTLLIEQFNCLGGMWTSGFVNPLFDQQNKGGIMREIVDALKERGQWGGFRNISFHYEHMKSLLEHMCRDAGVTLLYDTRFARVLMEEQRVVGVVCENVGGRCAYRAKVAIDCTGDANVAAQAGVAFRMGREEDGMCQAMTLMFLVGNIPDRYLDGNGLNLFEKLDRVYHRLGKPIPFRAPVLIPVPHARFGVVQFTHMYGYDALCAEALTSALIEGRDQMLEAMEGLRRYDEEFADLEIIASAPLLGVRESRRIVGEYTLTLDDVLGGATFPDAVTSVTFNIDIHHPGDSAQSCIDVKEYQIPFRCMVPRGVDGLLVAGRCISGTHEAMASYRVTGNCCPMGEAAGRAAADYAVRGAAYRR